MDDHTVRISEENLELLKKFKENYALSYNDIIGLGLKTLDGVKLKQIAVQSPVYKIRVSLNRVKINDNVKSLLENGYDLFIPGITHRQAMYVKRKFKSMGYETNYVQSEGDGKNGFLFSQPIEPTPRKTKTEEIVKAPLPTPTPFDG
jgi:hypothetical protein